MTNSKQKGARYERHIVGRFKDYGIEARRTAQYCGNTGDAADVDGVLGLHIECKHQEQLRIYDWMAQAVHDSQKSGNIPMVIFKKNNHEDLCAVRFDDMMKLYKPYYEELLFRENMNPPESEDESKRMDNAT